MHRPEKRAVRDRTTLFSWRASAANHRPNLFAVDAGVVGWGRMRDTRPALPPRRTAYGRSPTRESPSSKPKCLPCYPPVRKVRVCPRRGCRPTGPSPNNAVDRRPRGGPPNPHPGPVTRRYGLLRAATFSRNRAFTPDSRLRWLIGFEIVPGSNTPPPSPL